MSTHLSQSTGKLTGIFTPNMVPLDANGRVNEDELARYIDWLIRSGVHGLYPNGSSGEFPRFSAEERRLITRTVCQVAKGRVPVLAGAAEANARDSIKACEKYAEYGARAVAIISPIFYRLGQESLYAYFREIAVNSPLDVTVYNIPMLSSPIEVKTVQRLSELQRITGLKDSSGDVANMCRLIQSIRPSRPDFSFLTGWEAVLIPMLCVGADGGTNAASGIVPEVTRFLFDTFRKGDITSAMDVQFRLIELFDTLLHGADFPEGFRVGVEMRGFKMGSSRQPLSEKQTIDRRELSRMVTCLISDFGVIERPATCPSGSDEISNLIRKNLTPESASGDMAETIANEVVAYLKRNPGRITS